MIPDPKKEIRVRFAPSPTGPLHIGVVRTAIFNWLFAQHEGGKFLLRIEDTDKERSKKKFEKEILENLEWLGLQWNDDPVHQSERVGIYRDYLKKLLDEHKAYYCFCTPEELELERQAQLSQGLPPRYGGRCKTLSDKEVTARLKKKPAVIRFKIPDAMVTVNDLVRGKVEFNNGLVGDIIIAKGLEEPLYNFAVVIDDFLMEITHVIRGEDHLSNTPKQIAIQEALGIPPLIYAHLPLILGPDKKKLSKRFAEKSTSDYRTEGYLPEALLNFLVLLGWHPEKDREVLSREEMITEFGLKRVQKGGAVWNQEKLDWLNAHYIRKMDDEELRKVLLPFIPSEWKKHHALRKIVHGTKQRLGKLSDFVKEAEFFFDLPEYPRGLLIWQTTSDAAIVQNLKSVLEILKGIKENEFGRGEFESGIMRLANELGRGEVLWPLRVALSGKDASPDPLELLDILGKDESVKRIKTALKKLTPTENLL